MKYTVKRFITGPIETNTWVLSQDSGACIIIDPSGRGSEVNGYIDDNALKVEAVCLTHGHFDHFLGLKEIQSTYPGIDVWIHPEDIPLLKEPDYNGAFMIGMKLSYTGPLKEYSEGRIQIGSFEMTLLHVPGHSPGGSALSIGNYCFSGDSLFAGSIGRSDFPGCDGGALIKNIKEKLLVLPDETIVCPGHGGRTTIGRERKSNPYLQ